MENKKIKILVAGFKNTNREILKGIIGKSKELKLVGEVASGRSLVQLCGELKPDIVITEISLQRSSGLSAAELIKCSWPRIGIIIFFKMNDKNTLPAHVKAGALGHVETRSVEEELLPAIQSVLNNQPYFCRRATAKVQEFLGIIHIAGRAVPSRISKVNIPDNKLNKLETEILTLICKGFTNKDIATYLGRSKRTIETIRETILRKTQTSNTPAVVVYAMRNKIFI